jgi:hypothetical protein
VKAGNIEAQKRDPAQPSPQVVASGAREDAKRITERAFESMPRNRQSLFKCPLTD